jgi:multidrug resistance efflux pump
MSTLGKILIGLNLVLAAAFFGWAANAVKTNQQWREKHDAVTADLTKTRTELTAEVDKLKAAKIAGEKDLSLLTANLATAKNDKERVQAELADTSTALANLKADLTKFAATYEGMANDKTRLQGDKDKAEKAQRDAEAAKADAEAKRDAAELAANTLKNDLEKANNMIADLEKTRTTLEKKTASLETQIDTLAANTGAKPGDFAPMPDITAAVLDVSNAVEPGLVALNVGSNKGVKRGFTFELYEGKTYKGQARVEFVHPDMCSAIILNKVQGQTIRQGDSAATRL